LLILKGLQKRKITTSEKAPHRCEAYKIWGAQDDGTGHWVEVITLI
jgi:hypothetical protein